MYISVPSLLAISHLEVYFLQTLLHTLITSMMKLAVLAVLLAIVTPSLCQRDWHVGADSVRPSGTRVHGHINTPSHNGFSGTAHGSHVFGGPYNGAQSVGAGVNYQHKVGPGTLSVTGGAGTSPGSSKVQGQVEAQYSVPLP